MSVWFTSDQHFFHARILELCDRPFRDVAHMNETIVNNHNSVVHPDDTVWMLGDFGMGDIYASLKIVSRLNGHLTLVSGNHDRTFRGGKKSKGLTPEEWKSVYIDAGFDEVCDEALVSIGKGIVKISHFPYAGDSHDTDRFDEFRLPDEGVTLLHGHTHSKDVITRSPKGTLQISVGVDAHNFMPVNISFIMNIINSNGTIKEQ